MTSLSDDAYVGTLHYKFLDPPVGGGGGGDLQTTCDLGNTTTTDINCAKLAVGVPHVAASELSIVGNLAPSLRIFDLPFNCQAKLTAFDTNVALESSNNNPLNLKTNGVQRIQIDTTGNTSYADSTGLADFMNVEGVDKQIQFLSTDLKVKKDTEVKNISIGWKVNTANDNKNVVIGNNISNAGGECVNIGSDIASGAVAQGKFSVAIGKSAGQTGMGSTCVAIGQNAGNTNQGVGILPQSQSIAIGENAGAEEQGGASIAIGAAAGNSAQKIECVAIGKNAGRARQQQGSIAIGAGAGASRQQVNSIAIGYDTCPDQQGSDCIAIGSVGIAQPNSSIAIVAGGIVLTPTNNNAFYVEPIRGDTNPAGGVANSLWWNGGTSEVCFHIP